MLLLYDSVVFMNGVWYHTVRKSLVCSLSTTTAW